MWLLIRIVSEHVDTKAFHRSRRVGGVGRAGYDPDMLLTLVMWGWLRAVRSSRGIERSCHHDVAFRIICAGDVPDHVTISRFCKDNHTACVGLFEQVLVLCAKLGMAKVETIALDGVKMASNASKDANRTEEGLAKLSAARAEAARIARDVAAAHADNDAREDALFGPDGDGGGQVPEDVVDPGSRDARIAQALVELQNEAVEATAAEQEKAAKFDAQLADGVKVRTPPATRRVEAARAHLADTIATQEATLVRYRRREEQAAARGQRLSGKPAKSVEEHFRVIRARTRLDRAVSAEKVLAQRVPVPAPTPVRNITDPQSRLQPVRGGGWVQGYNCQAFTCGDGIILATGVSANPSDTVAFEEMVDKACAAAVALNPHRPAGDRVDLGTAGADDEDVRAQAAKLIGTMLFDAGYLSTENVTSAGPNRLIAVGKRRHIEYAARTDPATGSPPADADPIEAMTHRLRTPEGIAKYRQRSPIAETPFGHAKHNLGFHRFSSRGLDRANSQWAFHAAMHNLGKILNQVTGSVAILPAAS